MSHSNISIVYVTINYTMLISMNITLRGNVGVFTMYIDLCSFRSDPEECKGSEFRPRPLRI